MVSSPAYGIPREAMANGQDERKLAAILAADVVGYSGLIEVTQHVGVGRGAFAVINVFAATEARRTR